MQLIEVSGATIMPDPKEWLTKQMTQEQNTKIHSHSHRKNDGPTTQQRRKHQITYLAFQVWIKTVVKDKVQYCLLYGLLTCSVAPII
jgi:hypothetical protein